MGDRLSFLVQENEVAGGTDVEIRKNVTDESAGDVVCQARVIFNK